MSTEFLDKNFIKEFREMLKTIRNGTPFDIYSLSLPNQQDYQVDTAAKLYVDGIDDKYFSKLNKQYVNIVPARTIKRNIYWNSGEIKGQEDYHVPKGYTLISTTINLQLPYKYKVKTDKMMEYVDYRDSEAPDINPDAKPECNKDSSDDDMDDDDLMAGFGNSSSSYDDEDDDDLMNELYSPSTDSGQGYSDDLSDGSFNDSVGTEIDVPQQQTSFTPTVKRFYYFVIPDDYLYPVTSTALVISATRKPEYYAGYRLLSITGYYFYLYVVNLKGLKNIQTQRIIKTGISPDPLKKQIKSLVDYWNASQDIFNTKEFEVMVPIDNQGNENLAYSEYEATKDYEERTDMTLAERKMSAKDISSMGY